MFGLILALATVSPNSPESASAPPKVQLRVLDHFPEDYLDRTVEVTVWFYSDFIKKCPELPDYYTVGINDRDRSLPSYGTSSGLVKSQLNYVITKAQAEQLVKEIDSDHPGRRTVKIRVQKEGIGDKVYYIARIIDIAR
jgi:hypothetical protein